MERERQEACFFCECWPDRVVCSTDEALRSRLGPSAEDEARDKPLDEAAWIRTQVV